LSQLGYRQGAEEDIHIVEVALSFMLLSTYSEVPGGLEMVSATALRKVSYVSTDGIQIDRPIILSRLSQFVCIVGFQEVSWRIENPFSLCNFRASLIDFHRVQCASGFYAKVQACTQSRAVVIKSIARNEAVCGDRVRLCNRPTGVSLFHSVGIARTCWR
jgi:hypothetical protein